jgi:hypothetical protein
MGEALPDRLTVNVERRHIDAGRRSSRCGCPVALAIKEQFPGRRVVVQLDEIRIDDVTYPTPPLAAQFMGTYDYTPPKEKAYVPPQRFELKKKCRVCIHEEHAPGACVGTNTRGRICMCGAGAVDS